MYGKGIDIPLKDGQKNHELWVCSRIFKHDFLDYLLVMKQSTGCMHNSTRYTRGKAERESNINLGPYDGKFSEE